MAKKAKKKVSKKVTKKKATKKVAKKKAVKKTAKKSAPRKRASCVVAPSEAQVVAPTMNGEASSEMTKTTVPQPETVQ